MENALTSCQQNHHLCKHCSVTALQRYPVLLKFSKIHNFNLLLFMSQSEFESEIVHNNIATIISIKYMDFNEI